MRNELQSAGIFTRISGAIVDLFLVNIFLKLFDSLIIPPVLTGIILLFYFGVLPYFSGGTPGQKLFGLTLVDVRQQKIVLWRSLLRSALFLATFWWFFYVVYHWGEHIDTTSYFIELILPFIVAFFPLLVVFFTKKHQTLYDLLSGTCVLLRKRIVMTEDGEKKQKRGVVEWLRLLSMTGIGAFLAYGLFTFGTLLLVYGPMAVNHKKSYDQSFRQQYTFNDYNDSMIQFYVKELEAPSKAFVQGEGMYEIFASDVKRDLAGNCISYFLRQYKEDNWIDQTSNLKKSIRNRYADTEERIAHTKKNESFIGKHFYEYDINDVNEIIDNIANIWGDENANERTCRKQIPVNEMFQEFMMQYIKNREEALSYDKRELKYAKPTGTLSRVFYQRKIEKTEKWLSTLYERHPEYKQYMEKEKEKKTKKKQQTIWKKVKENRYYPKGYFKGVNADIYDENGKTPLMVAVETDRFFALKNLFLEADVDFYLKDKYGVDVYNQLRLRMQSGDPKARRIYNALRVLEVKKILQGKAKIMGYTFTNTTDVLSIVIDSGKCKDFDFPARTECRVAAKKKKKRKWDPIFRAIDEKDNNELERLLAEGGHVNVRNGYGHTALVYAMSKNSYALRRLVESGADLYALGKFGHSTALMNAVLGNDIQSAKLFLEHGMDVNFKHPNGRRVLDTAVQQCEHTEMIELLLDYGAKFLLIDEHRLEDRCGGTKILTRLKKVLK